MRTIRAPDSKQATTLVVAVKCRPLTAAERSRSKSILRVDKKMVLVVPPEMPREYVERVHHRSKERIYAFDHAFGPASTNRDVYETTIASMIPGVIQGLNATIFAYGATGSGKTYTMAGTQHDPGLMVHSLQTVFDLIAKQQNVRDFEVTCSYLEVYNEVIYDLLEKSSDHLELREDPDQGIMVAGLKRIKVNSAEKIFELLNVGNSRRKTESTEANATSSRSHGVLEIIVKHQQKNHYRSQVLRGKLALVDLAGSERASETNNAGQKLRDGANINRSLLALANCINALGKQQKKGLAYVPYRNSKLTRILKDGLSGNSRTVMIATVSPADDQYHYTINTLKYADRAKEIKTHIQKNIGTIDNHVADYQRMIDNLQGEVCQLKKELADKECQLSVKPTEKAADDELAWLDILSRDTNENVEERINLQKALSELEDINLRNRMELQKLDDLIAKQQTAEKDEMIIQALRSRRQVILDNIRDNDEAGANYRKEIEINEQHRHKLQKMIDKAMHKDGNKTYLRILSQYRLLGMTNIELQFQIAVRDQIIHNLREAQSNLWSLLASSGLNDQQILEIATKQGITIEDWIMPPESPVFKKQAIPVSGQCSQGFTLAQSPCYHTLEKSYRTYPRFSTSEHTPETSSNQGTMDDKTSEFKRLDTESLNVSGDAFSQNIHFMQEHHNTFALASHLHSPSALWEMRRGNVMKKKTHHQSAENKIQNYCSNDNVYVDSGESRTLGCWDDSYCQPKYSIYLTPQPLLDFEQPQKESWHVNNDALNCLSGMEIRKSFENHSSVEVDNVQNLQKSKFGRVLLSMPPGGRETYFIHNKNTVRVLAHSNSRHLVYRGHCSRCKNYPVFSEWRSPLNDQTQRHIATEDSVCQGSKFYSDFEFRYFANPHGQSWPG